MGQAYSTSPQPSVHIPLAGQCAKVLPWDEKTVLRGSDRLVWPALNPGPSEKALWIKCLR